MGTAGFRANTIPKYLFAFAEGLQHGGIPLQTIQSPMMLSDSAPSASGMVEQATSLGSMVVKTENSNHSHESTVVIPCNLRQTGQRDGPPATPSTSCQTGRGDRPP